MHHQPCIGLQYGSTGMEYGSVDMEYGSVDMEYGSVDVRNESCVKTFMKELSTFLYPLCKQTEKRHSSPTLSLGIRWA